MKIIKNILWVDCTAGALAGILAISLSEWLSNLYSAPQNLLLLIGVANLLYACYSFSLAVRAIRQEFLINILITANGIWALVCIGIVTQSSENMTLLGSVHIAGEAIFVGGLACLEWKWRNQLLTAA
jgi:hypothetical protein